MKMISQSTAAKLFVTGATVGPIVDSLHNQCLLIYETAPICIYWPSPLESFAENEFLFCSSWAVPPLLAVAYVVLGGILPKMVTFGLDRIQENIFTTPPHPTASSSISELRTKAFLAVTTTALIIKLSETLETHPDVTDQLLPFDRVDAHLVVMLAAVISQWIFLDGTMAALIAATITSIGGPLAELPFVANNFWVYLEQASDYFPLMNVDLELLNGLLGEDYQRLALSSITGPCYFAVTLDAIALGRWFDSDTAATTDRDA